MSAISLLTLVLEISELKAIKQDVGIKGIMITKENYILLLKSAAKYRGTRVIHITGCNVI